MAVLLLLVLVGFVVLAVVPTVVGSVFRALGRQGPFDPSGAMFRESVDARLTRIEDAIDAMAVQIDHLRVAEEGRYLPASREPRRDPPTLPDPPA
jgi:hypothetical protein